MLFWRLGYLLYAVAGGNVYAFEMYSVSVRDRPYFVLLEERLRDDEQETMK